MNIRGALIVLIALLGVGSARATGPVDASILPAFIGNPDESVDTFRADLENHSPQTQSGSVSVSGGTVYPFTLPPYGKQSIFLYHVYTSFGAWSWRVQCSPSGQGPATDIGNSEVANYGASSDQPVLAIAPMGETVDLGSRGLQGRSLYRCTAELSPDRGIAYAPFVAVVVTDAAEHAMTPEVAEALKEYALSGGTLILGSPKRRHLANAAPYGRYEEPCGFGTTIYLGFDPSDQLQGTKSENEMELQSAIPTSRRLRPTNAGFITDPISYQNNSGQSASDPFSVKLPPFAKVATLLGIYFLAVVPLNYFLLRKLQKPELTWVTAPLLALVFAGALFSSAKGLYQSTASSATRGTLMVQEGLPKGVFSGASDIFLPKSGSVPLNIVSAEYLDDRSSMDPGVVRSVMDGQPTPMPSLPGEVDEKSIEVPAYQARNLEIKELGLVQTVNAKDWFEFQMGKPSGGFIAAAVKNDSPYAIEKAVLYAGDIASAPQTLKPGETIKLETVPTLRDTEATIPPPASALVAKDHRLLLTGFINDLPVGANVGNRVKERTNIELAAFARPELRLQYLELPPIKAKNNADRSSTR
jgi:hypothetical protein